MSVTPTLDAIKPFESQLQFGPSLIFMSEEFICLTLFSLAQKARVFVPPKPFQSCVM
jgi:hypothetical protein